MTDCILNIRFVRLTVKCLQNVAGLTRFTSIDGLPGRNMCSYLALLNFSTWIIIVFESQNVNSVTYEAEVFGVIGWAIIQRLTLPICIFFRFHAAVFSLELWKEYSGKDQKRDMGEFELS